MSAIVAGGAAVLYAATVVGAYRWYVGRQRAAAGGFTALERLDWDALVAELLPGAEGPALTGVPPHLPSGEPTPPSLLRPPPPGHEQRRALVLEVVVGTQLRDGDPRMASAGLTAADADWLVTVSHVRRDPEKALERLERRRPSSAAEVYLREYLRLSLRANVVNREFAVFACKRRLGTAIARFGDAPCLYFLRARASSLVGLNRAAIDDLARAVYFSRQTPFYVSAVIDTPYVAEARPALAYQCRHGLDERRGPGQRSGQ